jgi:hypothetical protein
LVHGNIGLAEVSPLYIEKRRFVAEGMAKTYGEIIWPARYAIYRASRRLKGADSDNTIILLPAVHYAFAD